MANITFEYVNAAVRPDEFVAPPGDDGGAAYNNGATYACKCIIEAGRRDPLALANAFEAHRKDAYCNDVFDLLLPDQQEVLDRFGMTGFQWGWAVAAAAYLLEQPPTPNGALLEVTTRAADPSGIS